MTGEDFGIKDDYDFLDNPEPDGFSWVTEEQIDDQSRWSTYMSCVAQKKEDNSFWQVSWGVGSTEQQEVDLELYFTQVYPKQVTKTIYTSKKD